MELSGRPYRSDGIGVRHRYRGEDVEPALGEPVGEAVRARGGGGGGQRASGASGGKPERLCGRVGALGGLQGIHEEHHDVSLEPGREGPAPVFDGNPDARRKASFEQSRAIDTADGAGPAVRRGRAFGIAAPVTQGVRSGRGESLHRQLRSGKKVAYIDFVAFRLYML